MSREQILAQVNSYTILAFYLAPFHNEPQLIQGHNISNPFLSEKQKTPSFNIFCDQKGGHEWKFKDFATGEQGSCFDLIMKLFNLDFIEAKARICQDFNLSDPALKTVNRMEPTKPMSEKKSTDYSIKPKDFTKQELDFWSRYGITINILNKFKVRSLAEYSAKNKEDKPYTLRSDNNKFIFAYDQGDWCKLYKPLDDKKYRFQYVGEKPENFVFGLKQLPEKGHFVFLTGGEKDVMSLAAKGYNAISLNSETAKPTTELLSDLRSRFAEVVILYDNDKTGIEQGKELSSAFGLSRVILPELANNGKDISDFFATGGKKEGFDQIVEERISAPEIPNLADFANSAYFQNQEKQSKDTMLLNMPFLPEWIYSALPEILKEGASVLIDRREKDIFLTGALGILSGCLRNVSGGYNGKVHFANLFVFIIAPAASGKGALTYAKQLGEKFHKRLLEESEKQKKIYHMELAEYKQKIGDKKANIKDLEPPVEPPFKILFIPGNNSSSRIIQHLKEGAEQGIFCETEADSMGNVLKQDWGSYSDLLRKGFHHEPVSYSRKTNKEYIEINKPKLSVALAGTPGQVEGLIKSAEDGLFSRFLFYTFKSEPIWIDAGPTLRGVNLTQHFEGLSSKVLQMIDYLEANGKIEFHLTDPQWKKLNAFGNSAIKNMTAFVSEDLASTAKRFGLILYRISMILTALRYFENGEAETNFVCSDEDFEIALALMEVFKEHSIYMFQELPKSGKALEPALKLLFDALPANFQRKDAVCLSYSSFQIPERTTDLYLAKMVQAGVLHILRPGHYQKQSLQ
jgi:hypothetical protein